MKNIRKTWILVFLIVFGCFYSLGQTAEAAIYPAKYKIPKETRQLILARYKKNSKGKLYFYQRKAEGTFKKKLSCTAYFGKKGIGKKKEGDKKSPKGLFTLDQSFGILKNPGTKMPYIKVNSKYYWCSDSKSKYYNTLIRSDKTKHKCKGEHLYKYKGYYDYAVSIGYNKDQVPGKGSAIFLHCSKKKATGGCIAIEKKYLKKILKSLNPERQPMILIDKW